MCDEYKSNISDLLANAKPDTVRYCYVVTSKEVDIVGVWSGRDEAIEAGKHHMEDQGVTKWEVDDVNDSLVVIKPIEYDTYEEVAINRFVIQ